MAVPKRKKSKSVTKMGQANKGYKFSTSRSKCKECYNPAFTHITCKCEI